MPWKKGNRLRAVREDEASQRTREIYRELMALLGVPFVSAVFQVYAGFPKFLPLQWSVLRPLLASRQFFQLADRLRADGYTRAHNYFEIPDLCSRVDSLGFTADAKQELGETIDLFSYSSPLILLIVAAQQQAFDGNVGTNAPPLTPANPGHFARKPILVDEESAGPDERRIFDEVKRAFGIAVVPNDLRALARWPDFLIAFWNVLQPLFASPLYQECQYGIRESAWNLARELPGSTELSAAQMTDAGMVEDDIASVVRLTQAFTRGLSSAVLNISIAKIGMEGGNRVGPAHHEDRNATRRKASGSPNRAA